MASADAERLNLVAFSEISVGKLGILCPGVDERDGPEGLDLVFPGLGFFGLANETLLKEDRGVATFLGEDG